MFCKKIQLQKGFMKQMKYNVDELKNQVFSEEWDKKISSCLPKNLDEQFKASGSFKRFRGICDSLKMIRAYLGYAFQQISFIDLAIIAKAMGLADMSDTSWRKRLLKIIPFLEIIISFMLKAVVKTNTIQDAPRLMLVDATNVRLQGKDQHLERIHVCFDLNNNRIDQLKVTDEHVAESLAHFSMKPGQIFTGDRVYSTMNNCAYAIKQGADFILRITPQNFPIYDINGNRIDYKTLRPVGKEQTRETRCFIKEKDKRGKTVSTYLVRVIVGRIPKSKVKAAQKRKKSNAKKKQRNIQAETIQNAGFVFLVTSLTEENYGINALLELYRSRWQIELLFKCFKQLLKIKTIRIASPKYARAMIYLWLIIFLITERNLIKCKLTLEYLQESPCISIWRIFKLSFMQINQILELPIPIKEFSCYEWSRLDSHKRGKRINQNENTQKNLIPNLCISGLSEAFKKK